MAASVNLCVFKARHALLAKSGIALIRHLKVDGVSVHFGRLINSQVFGNALESKAARNLRSQGLTLLCRNYRSNQDQFQHLDIRRGSLSSQRVFRRGIKLRNKHSTEKDSSYSSALSASSPPTKVQLPLRCNRPNAYDYHCCSCHGTSL